MIHLRQLGIRARTFGLALVPACVVGGLLMVELISGKLDDLDRSLRTRAAAVTEQLAPAAEYGVASGNLEVLQTLIDKVASGADIQGVAVYPEQGARIAQSGTLSFGDAQLRPHDRERVTERVFADSLVYFAPITRTRLVVEDYPQNGTPVTESRRQVLGWVAVEVSRATTRMRQHEAIVRSLVIVLGGLVVAFFLAWRIGRQITRPVRALTETVSRLGAGHFDARSPETAGAELGSLERGVNRMAAHLADMHSQMQERIDLATARLVYQANHDALTGLINRREFEQRLERALAGAMVQGREHALCFIDLDQFKVINDTCGHAAGDELLRQLALLFRRGLRERDTLARLGGDEFALLLENCGLADAIAVAEALRSEVQRYRFKWRERIFSVGVSVGVVAVNRGSGVVDDVLAAADAACYVAKDRGRNQIHVYEMRDSELARHRGEMQWVARVQGALEANRLVLYWQEIRPLHRAAGEGCHVELLLRMRADDGSLVPPMAFIPAAERYAVMPAIDTWVIDETLRLARASLEHGRRGLLFGVNLSGASLKDPEFRQRLLARLADAPELGPCLCFEITETAAIGNLTAVNAFIGGMKLNGCKFALDDFGSGLSSFNYLKNLAVDFLKIDGAFVREMVGNPIDRAMVDAIHRIGRLMGLQTVAEFVGSEDTLAMLREIGVDYAQGEAVSDPRPLTELQAWLAAGAADQAGCAPKPASITT